MKKTMILRKTALLFTGMSLTFSFCACGNSGDDIHDLNSPVSITDTGISDKGNLPETESGGNPDRTGAAGSASDSAVNTSGLHFLCRNDGDASCSTEEGYYYLSRNTIELSDDSYGCPLMYIDYASCREVYLCSSPGCSHNTPDCTAIMPYDEIPSHSSKLFLHQGYLYVLGRQYDSEGSFSVDFMGDDTESFLGSINTAAAASVLYRMNPDGTGRQKVYTFESGCTVEGNLAIDDSGLYIITKKLSTEEVGADNYTYTFSSGRKLIHLDLSSFTAKDICSLDFGDDINWQMTGCIDGAILLEGTDYGRKLTKEEYYDDDIYRNYYQNSNQVFAALSLADSSLREYYRMSNKDPRITAVLEDTLYVTYEDSKEIIGVNIITGKERCVSTIPQNYIWGTLKDTLYCHSWDFTDHTYYFVNVKTGEVQHSGLVNKTLGWDIDIIAERDSDVLVIYDYDATPSDMNDGAYEITLYQYGLISKEDLYAGKDNYRKIQMAGKGY